MGCGASSKPSSVRDAELQLKRKADDFRFKLIHEVQEQLSFAQEQQPTMTRQASTSSRNDGPVMRSQRSTHSLDASTTSRLTTRPGEEVASPLDGSAVEGGTRQLRSTNHLHTGAYPGSDLVDHSDLTVTVPGKVGCQDDKVVVGGGAAHRLMRTKRVHKHKRTAKKVLMRRRLTSLDLEDSDEGETSKPTPSGHTSLVEEERRCVQKVLQRHFLFSSLQSEEQHILVEQMVRLDMAKGEVVCRKGEQGDACYIIVSGTCSVQRGDTQVAQLSAGHTFGELAMLYDVPRTATIVCGSPRVVLCMIQGPSFRRCLARFKERTLNQTMGFLNRHDAFSKLTLEEKRLFANALSPQAFEAGTLLIDEHISTSAEWMFILCEGTVEVTDQYRNRKVLGDGATISGQRMPYGHKAIVAKALTGVRCLAIGLSVINRLFGNIGEVLRRSTVRSFLEPLAMFHELTDKQKTIVAALFQEQQFTKGEVIVTALADPQLVLVIEGEVDVTDCGSCSWDVQASVPDKTRSSASSSDCCFDGLVETSNPPELQLPHAESFAKAVAQNKSLKRRLKRGDVFGESTFRECSSMENFLIARTSATVCRVSYDEVCLALRGHASQTPPLRRIVERNKVKEHLSAVFPFSALYEEMLDIVVEAFEEHSYPGGASIIPSGDTTRRFCLVVEGEALITKDSMILDNLPPWSSFGTRQLLLDSPVVEEVAAAATGCRVQFIPFELFQETCGVLMGELSQKIKYKDLHVTPKDIIKGSVLGQGQFGTVTLAYILGVEDEDFALKQVSKRKVLEFDQQGPIRLEREILSECCHPLIVRLIATFQDDQNVYFLMENVTGGDLFSALRDIGNLSEDEALFFGASIVLAIEYLHSRGIMYRDLKPENVMLQGNGFLKLVDMGCCSRKARSYTFVGTPEYVAPEVVLGKGYGKAVDWWSVGVCMYEMLCGPLPFGEGCADPLDTFREILEKPLTFPTKVTPEASDLLMSLLERMPEQRLGSSTFHWKNEVREHQFFELLQWDAILEQTTLPPYVPQATGPDRIGASDNLASLSQSEKDTESEDAASVLEAWLPLPGADLSCFAEF